VEKKAMLRIVTLMITLLYGSTAIAACPDYLNHDLRKLHSKKEVNLCESSAGKPLLIVNTASHCGYTKQFKGLEAVYQKYKDQGLEVVGFASDDFFQETDDEGESADICYVNYGVTFTMLAPTSVKGDDANPVFKELAKQTRSPTWNFNKYVVGRDGAVIGHFGSNTKPGSEKLIKAIESAL
jgi:glutathione peroxidase